MLRKRVIAFMMSACLIMTPVMGVNAGSEPDGWGGNFSGESVTSTESVESTDEDVGAETADGGGAENAEAADGSAADNVGEADTLPENADASSGDAEPGAGVVAQSLDDGEGVPVAQATETVYIDENFDEYTVEKFYSVPNQNGNGNQDSDGKAVPVKKGNITYQGNGATNRGAYSSFSIAESDGNKYLSISSDGFASSGRGVYFVFDYEDENKPDLAVLAESGQLLKLSMEVTSTIQFKIVNEDNLSGDLSKDPGFVTISPTSGDKQLLQIVIDGKNKKSTLITADEKGNVISSVDSDYIALSGTGFAGATFFTNGSNNADVKLDNVKVGQASAVTVTVKNGEIPIAGAAVTVDGVTVETDSEGKAVFALFDGAYTVSTVKAGYDTVSDSAKEITVNSVPQSVELALAPGDYEAEVTSVTVEGGQDMIVAPKGAEAATTTAFVATVFDQAKAAMDSDTYDLKWSVYPEGDDATPDPNVTIKDGVVSVSQGFKAESGIAAYVVKAEATQKNSGNVAVGIAPILIGNSTVLHYELLDWEVAQATRNAEKELSSVIELPDISTVTLNIAYLGRPVGSNTNKGTFTLALFSDNKFAGVQYNVDRLLTAWTGWNGTEAMNQNTDEGNFTNGEELLSYTDDTPIQIVFTINKKEGHITVSCGTETKELPFDTNADSLTKLQYGLYSNYGGIRVTDIIIEEAEASDPTPSPTPDATPDPGVPAKDYLVMEATGNTTTVTSNVVSGGAISGYQVTTSKDGVMVKQEIVDKVPATVDTTGADQLEIAPVYSYNIGTNHEHGTSDFEFPLESGNYDFIVSSTTNQRFDAYLNEQMLVNNMFQYGTTPNQIRVKDIVHTGPTAKIGTADYSSGVTAASVSIKVDVIKVPDIVDRVQKVYVLGDSLVAMYYNGGSADNAEVQTGWGQVLSNYLVDSVDVVDLANSGITASGLRGTAFSQIEHSAQKGDVLILESGYNDKTYDSETVMKEAVTYMTETAREKGLDVILVSPNASAHDYKESVAWTSYMKDVADATSAKYIDLSALSYQFLSDTYGTAEEDVATVAGIYNVSDRLHSTYKAANKWAALVAQQLKDSCGLAALVDTDYLYWFDDGVGNVISCNADGREAEGVVTVTYDLQGHGTNLSRKVATGSKLVEPTISKVYGYTFDGWYREAACTTEWNFESDTVAGEMTLYAKWTQNAGVTIPEEYVIFFEDFEGRTNAGEVGASSANASDKLGIKEEDTYFGDVLAFDFTGDSSTNSRGAVMKFAIDDAAALAALKQYVVEFDAFIRPGNNQETMFDVMGTDASYAVNDGMSAGYLLDLRNEGTGTSYAVNGDTKTKVKIPSGVWCHYTVYVDKEKGADGLVATTITNLSDETVIADKIHTAINGNGIVDGIYMRAGRYQASIKIDNVMVRREMDTDDFGELGEEQLSKVAFTSALNQIIKQPAADSPVHMPVAVKVTGDQGGDLSDKAVIKWSVIGAESDDGYLSLTRAEGTGAGTDGAVPDGSTAYFNVRNGVSSYIGYVKAEVTYGEKSEVVTTPFVVVGTDSANASQLVPDAGYPVNMNDYADSLVGYVGTANTINGRDIILNNWSIYGSNADRSFRLVKDADGTKSLEFTSTTGGSAVPTYQWVDQTEQYVIDFTARFKSATSFGVYFNTPNNSGNNPEWWASFTGSELKLNDEGSITGINTNEWYRYVVSADPSVQKVFIVVYDNAEKEVGRIEDINMQNDGSAQKYFCFLGSYPLSLNLQSFQAYKPVVATITAASSEDVARVPLEGAAAVTVSFSAAVTSTDGLKMTGPVTWELADEYANVELETTGAQTAQLKVSAGASGTVTVVASKDGKRAEKTIQLTTSTDAVSFTQSASSISIPFAGEDPAVTTYTAVTLDKDGNEIDGGTITYTLLDKDGVNETTVKGVTFVNGVLTVTAEASPAVVYVKAVNADGLANKVRVNIHGLSFAFGSADAAEGFTQVTNTTYSDRLGYGFQDVAGLTVNESDITGTTAFRFKAKVPNGNYNVTVDTTAETLTSEVVESAPSPTGIEKTGAAFKVAVCDGILDLTFPAGACVKTITISQIAAAGRLEKPAVYVIGDSTANNTASGALSWGNCVTAGKVTIPDVFSSFNNHGMAGRHSVNYYNQGRVEEVLLAIHEGDYVTVNMGINGDNTINESGSYPVLLSDYYVEGILQRGGIPVILTATPDGPVGDRVGTNYDAATGKFTNDRGDGVRNDVLRQIAEEKGLQVIELGKAGMDWMNTLDMGDVTEYNAEYGTAFTTVLEMVQSWYVDHNHYKEYLGVWLADYILGEIADVAPEPPASPDPSTEPSTSPDPSTEPSTSPDPSTEPSTSPDPSTEPSTSPDPSTEPSTSPDPSMEPSTSPDPSTEPPVSPDPSAEPTARPGAEPTEEPGTEPTVRPSAAPTEEPGGSIEVKVDKDKTAPDTEVLTKKDEVVKILTDESNQILTKEEIEEIVNGADCEMSVKIQDVFHALEEDAVNRIKETVPGFTVGQCIDISLSVTIVGKDGQIVSQRALESVDMGDSELEIEIKLSSELINTNESVTREYVVVREHDGVFEVLPCSYDAERGTLTFKSGKYSNFAIAYKDTDKTEPAPTIEPVGDDNTGGNNASGSSGQAEHTNVPKVGDHMDSIALICVLVIAMAAIGAVVVAKRRRKAE